MITEFFINLWNAVATWALGLLPDMTDAAGLVVTAQNYLAQVSVGASNLGAFIPWTVVGITLPVVLTLYVGLFILKIVKNLWAFVPFFGGAG